MVYHNRDFVVDLVSQTSWIGKRGSYMGADNPQWQTVEEAKGRMGSKQMTPEDVVRDPFDPESMKTPTPLLDLLAEMMLKKSSEEKVIFYRKPSIWKKMMRKIMPRREPVGVLANIKYIVQENPDEFD